MDEDDAGYPYKRKRISKACDICNKRKTRCDGRHPTCSQCDAAGIQCTYNRVAKKRGPRQQPLDLQAPLHSTSVSRSSRRSSEVDFLLSAVSQTPLSGSRRFSLPVFAPSVNESQPHRYPMYPSISNIPIQLAPHKPPTVWDVIALDLERPSLFAVPHTSSIFSFQGVLSLYESPYNATVSQQIDQDLLSQLSGPIDTLQLDQRPPRPIDTSVYAPPRDASIPENLHVFAAPSLFNILNGSDPDHAALNLALKAVFGILGETGDSSIMYEQAVARYRSISNHSLDSIRTLCFLSLYSLAKGAVKASYIYLGMANQLSERLRLDEIQTYSTSKILLIIQIIDVHLSFFFKFKPWTAHTQKIDVVNKSPPTFIMSEFNQMFQMQQSFRSILHLGFVLRQLANQEIAVRTGQGAVLQKEMHIIKIEKELRVWTDEVYSRQCIQTSQMREYGNNYSKCNELGFLQPLPWEFAFVNIMHQTAVIRLHKERILSLFKSPVPQSINGSIPYTLSKQAALAVANILEKILDSSPDLDYFPPFVSQCLFEVAIFCCLMAFLETSTTTAIEMLNTHKKVLGLLSKTKKIARYQLDVLELIVLPAVAV